MVRGLPSAEVTGTAVAIAVGDRAEILVLHGGGEDARHVVCGGVQIARPIVEVKAVGVLEDRVLASQFRCLGVHGVDEHGIGVAALGVDLGPGGCRDRGGHVVAAHDHEASERILHGEHVPLQQAEARLAHRCRRAVDCNRVRELAMLERHERRHDLGDRCDLDGGVRLALKVRGAVLTEDDGVGRGYVGHLGHVDPACLNSFAQDDVGRARLGMGRCGGAGEQDETAASVVAMTVRREVLTRWVVLICAPWVAGLLDGVYSPGAFYGFNAGASSSLIIGVVKTYARYSIFGSISVPWGVDLALGVP